MAPIAVFMAGLVVGIFMIGFALVRAEAKMPTRAQREIRLRRELKQCRTAMAAMGRQLSRQSRVIQQMAAEQLERTKER